MVSQLREVFGSIGTSSQEQGSNKQGNSTDECVIAALIRAIDTYLAPHQKPYRVLAMCWRRYHQPQWMGFWQKQLNTAVSTSGYSENSYWQYQAQTLKVIRECLISAADELIWRQDDEYYAAESTLVTATEPATCTRCWLPIQRQISSSWLYAWHLSAGSVYPV